MGETDEKNRGESADRKGTNTADVIVLCRFAWWKHISDCQSFFSYSQICPCAFMDDKFTKVNLFRMWMCRWLGWVLVHNPIYRRLSRLCVSQCFLSHSRLVWINSILNHTLKCIRNIKSSLSSLYHCSNASLTFIFLHHFWSLKVLVINSGCMKKNIHISYSYLIIDTTVMLFFIHWKYIVTTGFSKYVNLI